MQYLLAAALIAITFSILIIGELLRREARAQAEQLKALAATIERVGDKLAARIGRIPDRVGRVEKDLAELLERADAALSASGINLKLYRETVRDAAVDRMRELLAKGEEVSAMNVWRESTGKGMQEALDMVENLEREMNRAGTPA
jgi:hypothetical protein